MPPWENLLAFTLTALVIVAVPGPSVLFVIGRSLAWGRRGGVLSVVGTGADLVAAREAAYARLRRIGLDGGQFRTDIARAAAEQQGTRAEARA